MFLTYLSPIFVKHSFLIRKSDVSMIFSERLAYARKQKKMKQADLGKLVGTSGDIIGKYERGENTPSIEVAAKIADALGVTVDYLVKEGEYQNIDNETLKRMKELEKLSPEDKSHVFAMLDAFFAKTKLQAILK